MSHKTEALYNIQVTESQLRVLSAATEVLSRLGLGQVGDALDHLPLKPASDRDFQQWHDDVAQIREVLSKHTIHNVDGWTRHLSITSEDAREEARTSWDLYQVFRHQLSWDRALAEGVVKPGEPRKWPEMMGVHYDSPMQVGREPLAAIERACTAEGAEQTPGGKADREHRVRRP